MINDVTAHVIFSYFNGHPRSLPPVQFRWPVVSLQLDLKAKKLCVEITKELYESKDVNQWVKDMLGTFPTMSCQPGPTKCLLIFDSDTIDSIQCKPTERHEISYDEYMRRRGLLKDDRACQD